MKKNNIRSKFVKDALIESMQIAQSLKENSQEAVRNLLAETVKDEFKNLMKEEIEDEQDDTDEYEVSEVEDTNDSEGDVNNAEETEDSVEDSDTNDDTTETTDQDTEETSALDDTLEDNETEGSDNEDEWSQFDNYKISDNEYDFSNAEGDDFVKVYKLLKDDDQVVVVKKDENNIELKDNEAGTEYLIQLDSENGADEFETDSDDDMELNDDVTEEFDENDENMNESRIFEIALNEYNSNVGYTDNYQSKDAMTSDSMSEPGKNVRDWDKGVPKGKEKPFANPNKKSAPFNQDGARKVEESEDMEGEEQIDEANLSQSRWNDTHAVHNRVPAANKDAHRRKGMQKTSKGTTYRANGGSDDVNESLKKIFDKTQEIFQENKELKNAVGKFKQFIEEAAVTNMNLGNIIKLITENSTTTAEKNNIIKRFGKEAKTIEASKSLYESISNELKNKNVMNESIVKEKNLNASGSKMINETKIVEDGGLLKTLDLMNRLRKY